MLCLMVKRRIFAPDLIKKTHININGDEESCIFFACTYVGRTGRLQ